MKYCHSISIFALTAFTACGGCEDATETPDEPGDGDGSLVVFFGQTHVNRPGDEYFKLVSDRDAMVKVNITSTDNSGLKSVRATLALDGNSETITLDPPKGELEPIRLKTGVTQHSFSNSFTAVISKTWIKPGLAVTIEGGDTTINFDALKIGAPNKMIMNMFDVNFFADSPGDYPEGWKEELESKLPVSEIELRRHPNIIFSELTVPPRKDANAQAARVSSKEEYQTLTGAGFDGEQAAASQWNSALKAAAGRNGRFALFYTNIYGVNAGGQAGGYAGVGNGTGLGILHHELGHALSLPHWGNKADYPYRDEMHGIPAPEVFNGVHAGPSWGVDLKKMRFIPPTIQEDSVGGEPGTYKKDPMQGGGSGDQETGFLLRHFSDYSMQQIQNYLEGHIAVFNEETGLYSTWDNTTLKYSKTADNNGVQYATTPNTEVISVMAGVSSVTPQATIAYPPIGPYLSGLIDVFDPTVEADRMKADEIYCAEEGCDISLRIVQGATTKVLMLPLALDDTLDPLDGGSFNTRAVNLPASDGSVTKIELLLTPNVEKDGMPADPEVLYTWEN